MQNPSAIFAAQVPRYTSYPTAPHFHSDVGTLAYAGWLESLRPGTPVSLYIHIPFCDTLCWFCACNTTVVNNYAPVRDYCETLLKELEQVASRLGQRYPVMHIHWGGGSPTLLSEEDMRRITAAIHSQFDVAANAEIAVEIDPRGFNPSLARSLAACGVTRASIGLQDCSQKVQRAINRIQSDEEVEITVNLLRENGIRNINLDMVYGLPHQTPEGFEKNLDLVLRLHPDRIAIFGYAHVPHFKKHQALIPEAALPGMAQRMALARQAAETLCAHGYEAVGIDHFALPHDGLAKAAHNRSLRRNFQGYTTDISAALIALGASAIGRLPQGYVQNAATVPRYRDEVMAGQLPAVKGHLLTAEDRLRADVIQEIMCFLDTDVGAICIRHGFAPGHLDQAIAGLGFLAEEGHVVIRGRYIAVNPSQRQAARLASAAFDAYLAQGHAQNQPRHAPAA
jgi:oxygen-independent coproporphyrinogen-3 oxidase